MVTKLNITILSTLFYSPVSHVHTIVTVFKMIVYFSSRVYVVV